MHEHKCAKTCSISYLIYFNTVTISTKFWKYSWFSAETFEGSNPYLCSGGPAAGCCGRKIHFHRQKHRSSSKRVQFSLGESIMFSFFNFTFVTRFINSGKCLDFFVHSHFFVIKTSSVAFSQD